MEANNMVAMREALERCRNVLMGVRGLTDSYDIRVAVQNVLDDYVSAALSAPARNCDRFANSHDAIVAFENEIDYLKEGGADCGDLAAWLFSTAKGGAE